MRKIIHIDMDCFYAAIECRDDPSIADEPVGVGGKDDRGVLTTCNYIARKFGCRSAMPVFKARTLCPSLIIKPVRFGVYREESKAIRKIFRDYTEKLEPLSLDEAYLDVSHHNRFASQIAKEIRKRIWRERQLTASAGIGPNKMLAKIASDWKKPNGQFVIQPDDIESFMKDLPVRKIPGIGPKAEAKLAKKGIRTCGELQLLNIIELAHEFGPSWSKELHDRCRGIDDREVEVDRPRKSLSMEQTFSKDLRSLDDCIHEMETMLTELKKDLELPKNNRPFNKIFVKLKFANFQSTTKERISAQLDDEVYRDLLAEAYERSPHHVRLIGVGVRYREEADQNQMELFAD